MIFEDKDFIAKKIRFYRRKKGLTQAELAEQIGVSAKQLSRIEMATYTPSLITFLKILDVLGIDISEFGINHKYEENALRDKMLKLVYGATDAELKVCYEVVYSLLTNIKSIKNEKI